MALQLAAGWHSTRDSGVALLVAATLDRVEIDRALAPACSKQLRALLGRARGCILHGMPSTMRDG
eukprot:7457398-Pyramimonas_sp.AAC.1